MKDIRFYHIPINGGVVTVCTDHTANTTFTAIGLSLCSPNDKFSETEGRIRAYGRLARNPVYVQHGESCFSDAHRIIRKICSGVYPRATFMTPRWLVKSVKKTDPSVDPVLARIKTMIEEIHLNTKPIVNFGKRVAPKVAPNFLMELLFPEASPTKFKMPFPTLKPF